MINDSREKILRRVRSGLYGDSGRKEGVISPHPSERDFAKEAQDLYTHGINNNDSLLEQFIKELLNVNAEVRKAEKEEELRELIVGIIRRKGIASFAIWGTEYLRSLGLSDLLKREGLREIKVSDKNEIAGAEIGITEADYAISDTGTVVLLTDGERPRGISLIPPIHLAVVRKSNIMCDINELFVILKQRLDTGRSVPSCMTFITGPSRTADIELNLTLGVHGPKELYVLIRPD